MARSHRRPGTSELAEQRDPKAPLDGALLLAETQRLQKLLVTDLRERATKSLTVTDALCARHAADTASRRTGESFEEWQSRFVQQVAAAWVLSCVFVRTLEDRGLLERNRIAGLGAADQQRLFFEQAPSLTERDYLRAVFRELSRLPAGADLFDARHNPVWLLAPSADGVRALLDVFRRPTPEAPALRFGQEDTRFLGDLYQDLDEDVRKRFALLQTPRFIESFILDRTLERAIERFGLDDTTLIDPTCGSGHFILGAFARLLDHRLRAEPGLDVRQAALKALDAVAGADINPHAIAIARFRLVLAFLDRTALLHLGEAPHLPLHLAVANSLLHNPHLKQTKFMDVENTSPTPWGGDEFGLEDELATRHVLYRQYAAVVGNPPYITEKDPILRQRYRQSYVTASGKFALAAPFCERLFQLGRKGAFVGQITANSFMKREFGAALVEQLLPTINLDIVINTSGAYIPGHGTPTVLLFATTDSPQAADVLVVLAKRGELTTPADPSQGAVWCSIAHHWDELGFDNDYVSVTRVPRATLAKHPWALGGGGAVDLKELLEERATRQLKNASESIGFASFPASDEVFVVPREAQRRLEIPPSLARTLVVGENVRDWAFLSAGAAIAPYDDQYRLVSVDTLGTGKKHFWRFRTTVLGIGGFGSTTRGDAGDCPWSWYRWIPQRFAKPFRIVYAAIATHPHFVLDPGGHVFNNKAPVITLPDTAAAEDYWALLAFLNSSVCAFYLRQVAHSRGAQGINEGHKAEVWEQFLEYSGTALGELPLPSFVAGEDARVRDAAVAVAKHIVVLAETREASMPAGMLTRWMGRAEGPLPELVAASRARAHRILGRMCSLQEELDWIVYESFGLLSADDLNQVRRARDAAMPGFPQHIDTSDESVTRFGLYPGHRPFEVLLARSSRPSDVATAWFARNAYASPSTIADCCAPLCQSLVEARVAVIERNLRIRVIEQPEYKHRWTLRNWDAEFGDAGRRLLAKAAERLFDGTVAVLRRAVMARSALLDSRMRELADVLSAGKVAPDVLVQGIVRDDAVPFLAAWRYSATGLDKRAAWERTWELQRREDVGEVVGRIPVPPRYERRDFRTANLFRLRDKLDVPKERFVSYPGCESDQDGEPIYGWAGWNSEQRALVLGTLYFERKQSESWDKERLCPMLAGLLELLPEIRQWQVSPSDQYGGQRPGEYFEAILNAECRELGLTLDDLRNWRPPRKGDAARRKRAARASSEDQE
jgi:hypothetical protein